MSRQKLAKAYTTILARDSRLVDTQIVAALVDTIAHKECTETCRDIVSSMLLRTKHYKNEELYPELTKEFNQQFDDNDDNEDLWLSTPSEHDAVIRILYNEFTLSGLKPNEPKVVELTCMMCSVLCDKSLDFDELWEDLKTWIDLD